MDIGGEPLSCALLSKVFGDAISPSCEVVPGSELKQAGSHTAMLRDVATQNHKVFLKKVTATFVANKAWNDRRRVLLYIRNELRFYHEFAPLLRARGVAIPNTVHLKGHNLDGIEEFEETPPPAHLRCCGAMLFIEPLSDAARYEQCSPVTVQQARLVLNAAAKLHAAALEDVPLLERAATRLQRNGGSFALTARNPKELLELTASWERFKLSFAPVAPSGFFEREEIASLGARLQAAAPWIAEQLSPRPQDMWATLVHGDLKSMNVFLPVQLLISSGHAGEAGVEEAAGVATGDAAVLIDFASTGVGFGMADVAMHLVHALLPSDLDGGGEEALLDAYLDALAAARGADTVPYPRELALRHFRLGICDYGRFMMGRFWGAASPESFARQADRPNVALMNRNLASALRFVERLSQYLTHVESERTCAAARVET